MWSSCCSLCKTLNICVTNLFYMQSFFDNISFAHRFKGPGRLGVVHLSPRAVGTDCRWPIFSPGHKRRWQIYWKSWLSIEECPSRGAWPVRSISSSLHGVSGKQSIRGTHFIAAHSMTVENVHKVVSRWSRWPIRPCVSQQRYKPELHGAPSAWALGCWTLQNSWSLFWTKSSDSLISHL